MQAVRANSERSDAARGTQRLYARIPAPPVWVGVGIALALGLVFLAIEWLSGGLAEFRAGRIGLWESRDARLGLMVAVLAGYLPTARRYVALGARKNLQDLAPLLLSASRPDGGGLEPLHPRAARVAGLLGTLIAPLTALIVDREPTLYLQSDYWKLENGFAWVVGAYVGWGVGLLLYETLAYGRRFSDLARALPGVDLLSLDALAPFARQGLRSALLWLVLLSLFSLNAADLTWFAITTLVALGGGTTALLLPVLGAHQRVRALKREELERVRAALRGDPGALAGSPIEARAASLALADLLAYRHFVESLREWPFDSPTLLRFGLYLAIPLGSWLGGAFVERLLGAALD